MGHRRMLEESDRLLAQELQDRETAAMLQHLEITQGEEVDEVATPVYRSSRDATSVQHGHHEGGSHRRHRSHEGSSERLADFNPSQNVDEPASRPNRRPSGRPVRRTPNSMGSPDPPRQASSQDNATHALHVAVAELPTRSATMVVGDVVLEMEPGKCYGCRTFVTLPEGTRTFRCLKCGTSNHVKYYRPKGCACIIS